MAPNGAATLVGLHYHHGSPSVQVIRRRRDGTWTSPHRLSPIGSVSSPRVTVDGNGVATVIWQQANAEGIRVVKSSRRRPGGAWTAPVSVSFRRRSGSTIDAEVRADPSGNVVAIWRRMVRGTPRVESAFRPAGAGWQRPRLVSNGGNETFGAQAVIDRRGRVFAAWGVQRDAGNVLRSARRKADGTWSTPVRFSPAGVGVDGVDLAVDRRGHVTAVWSRFGRGLRLVVETAVHQRGGGWSPSRRLALSYDGIGNARVAVAPDGGAVAVWVKRIDGELGAHAARRTPGGRWLSTHRLAARAHASGHLDVVIDGDRQATAIWQDIHDQRSVIAAARQRPGASWVRTDRALEVANLSSWSPRIGLDRAGSATAVWAADNATEPETWLYTARHP